MYEQFGECHLVLIQFGRQEPLALQAHIEELGVG